MRAHIAFLFSRPAEVRLPQVGGKVFENIVKSVKIGFMDANTLFNESILPWLQTSGLEILAIVVVAFILRRFSGIGVERLIRRIIVPDRNAPEEAERKREDTLINIINATASVIILLIALVMILEELGVAIGPVLAAAGIVGVAVGFGAQYLIRDVISGLFIIMENQYRVGDVVCFGSTCGTVEKISLRITTFRDLDGTVHHMPHGEMKLVSNLSKYYARINLDIGVAYDADLEHVIKVVNKVGEDMAKDSAWSKYIIKTPQFLRVNDFGDSAVMIKILGEVKPLKQWEVTGELRKRLKIAFDREGIEIPFPQRVMIQKK